MQRLVVETSVSEFARVTGDRQTEKIEYLEVIHFIKQDPEEFSLICELRLKDRAAPLRTALFEPGSELQVLGRDRQGTYTVFSRSKPQEFEQAPELREFLTSGGIMLHPYRIRDGKVTVAFLGSAKQVKSLLAIIKRLGVRCKVQRFADARLLQASPLGSLTERQREVLTSAFRAGYYDLPRRVGSKELAQDMGIGASDLIKHRRKAERRLLAALIE